ncbi:MAG: GNAT family N-acetyltransferase [Bacteroidetes bacterium]|jgi:hypothetical protein|nr:GNAT family N-acetyltransferase [Bacteroidota bacterium]
MTEMGYPYKSNKLRYRAYCASNPAWLFIQDWWLDAVAGPQWDVVLDERADQIRGGWVFYRAKRFGLSYVTNAPLSPYQGVFFCYPADLSRKKRISYEHRVLSSLYKKLPRNFYLNQRFHPQVKNLLSLIWAGFSTQFRYTYVLTEIHLLDKLWDKLHPEARRKIRKFEIAQTVKISSSENPEIVYQLHRESMRHNGHRLQISEPSLSKLDAALAKRKLRKIWIAVNDKREVLGATYIVWFEGRAYYILGGVNRKLDHWGVSFALLWHAIKTLPRNIHTFDFEGSMVPGVERVFRSFGAKQEISAEIKRYKFPLHLMKIWR